MAGEAIGTTVSFGTFSGVVESMTAQTIEGAVYDTTGVNATIGSDDRYWRTKQVSALNDPGSIDMVVQLNTDTVDCPVVGDTGTLTITWPNYTAFTSAAVVSKLIPPATMIEGKLLATITFQLSGEPTTVPW